MEYQSYNKKRVIKLKSVTNNYPSNTGLFQFERSNSNTNITSISKKTGCFEENVYGMGTGKMNSFSTKISPNNLCFSIANNVAIRSSIDLSLKDLKDKTDINTICANINISIDNPNFSINNIENKTSSIYEINDKNTIINKELSEDNPNLISFKGSNIESNSKDNQTKLISSIYADYLANKSNSEIHSDNSKDESKLIMLNNYLEKNKILQYEFSKGCIAGFSAYTYQNQEPINKNKLSINININKVEEDNLLEKKEEKSHLINFFSLFCGDKKDEDDDLTKFLQNNFKDILLEDKDLLSNPTKAIKNSFIKCEVKYINYYLKEKNKNKNSEENFDFKEFHKIQICSIFIILNIDDIIYMGKVGNLLSILSSDLSTKIEYISKENITQEEYDNKIKKKRKSLYSLFNHNINYINDLNNSRECFNPTNNHHYYKIFNINNNAFTYEFIRIFPGKRIYDILACENNKNSDKSIHDKKLNEYFVLHKNSKILKMNNFVKNNDNMNYNLLKNRRASLGPFFKISPKNNNYNPKKNYRNSCAQSNQNNKAQVIRIISSYPDIIAFKNKNKHDFIFIGCKIIFEKITCDKICKSVYDTMKKCLKKHRSYELYLGWVIKDIIKMCITAGITENISCIFICFNSLKQLYLKNNIDDIKNILVPLCLTFTSNKSFDFYNDLLNADFINVDKANNYYEIIEKYLNIINEGNEQLIDVIDNAMNKKNDGNPDGNSKNKKAKKRCCCFC